MVGAHLQNEQRFPIYGCYVLGRNWFFVVLDGADYAVSDSFAATQADLYRIYQVLVEASLRIEAIAQETLR